MTGNGQNEPIAHHVVHIGIDGLRPDCIELAPGGAPNLLSRFTSEVRSGKLLKRQNLTAVRIFNLIFTSFGDLKRWAQQTNTS